MGKRHSFKVLWVIKEKSYIYNGTVIAGQELKLPKNMRSYSIIMVILIALCPLRSFSQLENSFCLKLKQIGLTYTSPVNFTVDTSYDKYVYTSKKHIVIGRFTKKLVSTNDSVLIGVSLNLIDTTLSLDFIRKHFKPDFDPNYSYKSFIQKVADTVVHKVDSFDAKTLEYYNADVGGLFTLAVENPYKNAYEKCRVLFLSKRNRGHVFVYYFHNEDVPVDDFIAQTRKMFAYTKEPGRYKTPDGEWIPYDELIE